MITIYKITNIKNNKIYIGQTKNFKERIRTHKYRRTIPNKIWETSIFYLDIKKYGFENFKTEIIEETNSQEKANFLEIKYINKYNSIEPNGYNVFSGGKNKGTNSSLTFKEKVSKSRKLSNKINRVKIYECDYNLKIIKIWESKQKLLKEKNIFIPHKFSKNQKWLRHNDNFYFRNIKDIENLKQKQIVLFDKNGKELSFKYTTMEYEREGFCNVVIGLILKGKQLTMSNGKFFLFRKDSTQTEINKRINYKNPKKVKKIICNFENGEKIIFNNSTELANKLNLNRQMVARFCKRKEKYKNYFFEYLNE